MVGFALVIFVKASAGVTFELLHFEVLHHNLLRRGTWASAIIVLM